MELFTDCSETSSILRKNNSSIRNIVTPSHVDSKKSSFNLSQKSGRRDSFRGTTAHVSGCIEIKIAQSNILPFCQEGNKLVFYKGGSTVPLVSGIYSGSVRNDNVFEVLDRLKFLTRE